MGLNFNTILANKKNYGKTRKTSSIKYIVIHFTANKNDKAVSNAKYFLNNVVKASAHYFVDEDNVYQSVKENVVAYAVGGSKYSNCTRTGGGKYYGKCTNSNSISVEMCNSVTRNEDVENMAVELIKELMDKYNITSDFVIRHFDVTGKTCPKYLAEDEKAWKEFQSKLVYKLDKITKDSPVAEIKKLQSALNKIDVGLKKLAINGKYTQTTQKYLITVWEKWDWNKDGKSTGWTAGTKTLTKLNLI